MFVFNSRVVLVIATYGPSPQGQDHKQALFRRFRSILPISLTSCNSTRLRLLTLGTPVSVLGTLWKFVVQGFFIGNWSCLGPPTIRWLCMTSSGSRRKGTPQSSSFKQDDSPVRAIHFRHRCTVRHRKPSFQVRKYKSVSLSCTTVKNALRSD